MLPPSQLVNKGIDLRAVSNGSLDHAPLLDGATENEGVAQRGTRVSSQHSEGGSLPGSVYPQESKTLHTHTHTQKR